MIYTADAEFTLEAVTHATEQLQIIECGAPAVRNGYNVINHQYCGIIFATIDAYFTGLSD